MPNPIDLDQKRVLLVDDDANLLRVLSLRLKSEGFEVEAVDSGGKALTRLGLFRPHVVVSDLRMDGIDGLTLFKTLQARNPTLPVIILTAHGTIDTAVDATQGGVFAFLTKPIDSREFIRQVQNALKLCGDGATYSAKQDDWRAQIITQSPQMEDVLNQAHRVAPSDVSVLIQGDSGTGKELVAQAIHNASPRKNKPFIAVNCSAIPEHLLESELFGHRKGAFTGAVTHHVGLFKAADGGTLFMDEIGDMPKLLQTKLLRVLQEMRVRAVGATEDVAVDVRIISATHVDLDKAMAEGRFREDLYYRLNVVTVNLPSLAERREDIPLLAGSFLKELTKRYGKKVRGFSPDAMEYLVHCEWPGNVRQLRNVVEQALTLSSTPLIPLVLVQKALQHEPKPLLSLRDAREEFERNYLIQLLQMTSGKVSRAAKLAERNRTEFYRLLSRHQLDPNTFKSKSS